MKASAFKNITLYKNAATGHLSDSRLWELLEQHTSTDSTGSQWRSYGFVPVIGQELAVDIGYGVMCVLQANERILPGPVVKERMQKQITRIEHSEGRKVSKKEFAQIRDEITLELLPKAFIRRKQVPIILRKENIFVFTSSTRLGDDAISNLIYAIGDEKLVRPLLLSTLLESPIPGVLRTIATGEYASDYEDGLDFLPNDYLVLKGKGKQTIKIADKDIDDGDVQPFLKEGYDVSQVGVRAFDKDGEEGDPDSTFILTDKLLLKKVVLPNIKEAASKDADDADATTIATAYMYAAQVQQLVKAIEVGFDLREDWREASPQPAGDDTTPAANDSEEDDDL